MEFEIKEQSAYTREISVTVPWSALEEAFERTVGRFRREIHLSGFRKGKVPRKILFQKFGQEIEADFAQETIERYYRKVLDEIDLTPISQATIDHMTFRRGEPLEFTATFEIEPEVQLFNYQKKFKIKKKVYIPDDEDVDLYIEELRRQFAELRTVETGSEEGHLLLVDMQELDESGLPIIGRKVEDRYIQVGDGIFGGENLNRLTGLKVGDDVVIEAQREAQGPPRKYGLKTKNVHEEVLPELNDEFIKKTDKSAASEEEFRKNVMGKIKARLQRDSENEFEDSIKDYFVQNTTVEVPDSMLKTYIENALEDARKTDGETLDEVAFREQIRPPAIRNLKWYLIRKAIVDAEELSVTDEEVDEKINEILGNVDEGQGKIRRYYRKPSNREHLREDLLNRKLIDRLKSFAKTDEVTVYTRDLRKQRNHSTILTE